MDTKKAIKGEPEKPAAKKKEPKPEAVGVSGFSSAKRKVAIVGFAPSSRDKAPYNDSEFEIWGCNELYTAVPRVDVLFELHSPEFLVNKKRNPAHIKWMQENQRVSIFMQEAYPEYPKAVAFPKDAMIARFGRYFTNSISWMLALAIDLQFDEIHVYGVDMATSEEYGGQRPSVEFFLGVATGIYQATGKCKLYVPSECDLLKSFHLYGYEDDKQTEVILKKHARREELQSRINSYRASAEQNIAAMNQMMGALDDTKYWARVAMYGDEEKLNVPET